MYTSTALIVFGLATLARSHMIMNTPVPFGKSTLNNFPLNATGADFPCKQRSGVYDAEGASNTMPLGSVQPLSFTGSATHGGGSCQISITYDQNPTASSTFKVIHSIEGGCPIKNVAGNTGDSATAVDPDTYSFTVPSSLPTGNAVLAWTWFNKIGNREMYMNCAPITITGSTTKRNDEEEDLWARNYTQLVRRDTAAYDALPDMFVANIKPSTCGTVDSQDLQFPNPGDSLELFGTATATPVLPTGSCPPVVAATGAASAGSGNAGASVGTSAATSTATSRAASPVASQLSKSSAAAGGEGGVFVTVTTSAGSSKATSAVPVVSSKAPVVSSAAPLASPVSSAAASVIASSSSPASTGTAGTGTAIAAGTACTTEGQWNCIGGTSFQRCASGQWSAVMEVAAGTTCTSGQSADLAVSAIAAKERRGYEQRVRFSGAHLRRHLLS